MVSSMSVDAAAFSDGGAVDAAVEQRESPAPRATAASGAGAQGAQVAAFAAVPVAEVVGSKGLSEAEVTEGLSEAEASKNFVQNFVTACTTQAAKILPRPRP